MSKWVTKKDGMKSLLYPIAAVVILLAIGVSVIDVYNTKSAARAERAVFNSHVVAQSAEALAANTAQENISITTMQDVSMLSWLPFREAPPLKEDVLGGIHIPSVNVTLPILNGTSESALSLGAVMLEGSNVLGGSNVALGAHSKSSSNILFTPLFSIEEGADIYVTNKQNLQHYVVEKRIYARAGREDLLLPQDFSSLTLVTGYESETEEQVQVIIRARILAQTHYSLEEVGELHTLFGY